MENSDHKLIINQLLAWDEKRTDVLKVLYEAQIDKLEFIHLIVQWFLTKKELELATSWLIKHHIDSQQTLKEKSVTEVISHLKNLTYWGSQLHIIQIIPKIKLTKQLAEGIENEIFIKLKSDNKFVRASAYEAYFEVVKLFPDLKNEFEAMCLDAFERESASVKVKIKRILNKI